MRRPALVVLSVCCALVLGAVAVLAQGPKPLGVSSALGTGFTYQGQLKKNNAPVNDPNCSLTFSLWDSPGSGSPPTGGTQMGGNQTLSPVAVTNGLFTVLLNSGNQFGMTAFNGQERWLQVAVQCTGDGAPVTLARQQLTAAPYALFSAAPWLTSGSDIAYMGGNVGIGTASPGYGKLDVETTSGIGVYGHSYIGVYGDSPSYIGVYGHSDTGLGVHGTSTDGAGLAGNSSTGYGVYATSTDGFGVYGHSDNGLGVYGHSVNGFGVTGNSAFTAVAGISFGPGPGVFGSSSTGAGVYGISNSGDAGSFQGNVNVSGDLTVTGKIVAGVKDFKIDHPLDPANEYLVHASVESAEMLNLYTGNVTTDDEGTATVVLPDWFEALNEDFRYQLTPIGQFAQAIVASEIEDHRFTIKTDKPHVKVSWQVTGIRHDPYAQQHPLQVEEAKSPAGQGKYLYPKEYGQPESLGIDYPMRQRLQPPVARR